MLRTGFLFLIMALIAAAVGSFRTHLLPAYIAWLLFVLFYILAILSAALNRSGEQQMN